MGLAGLALGLSAVGTGIGAVGAISSARSQSALANYNYTLGLANAKQQQFAAQAQAASLAAQAKIQASSARIQAALAESAAKGRENNAQTILNEANARTAQDRQNILKERQDQQRLLSIQRATIAGSGVVESGSPLEVLADQAGAMQQALNEAHYQSELQRRKSEGQASLELFGAKLERAGAEAKLAEGLAVADLTKATAALEEQRGSSLYRAGVAQAEYSRMQGKANATGAILAGVGGLFSGLGMLGSQWTSWRNSGAIGGNAYGAPAVSFNGAFPAHSVASNFSF